MLRTSWNGCHPSWAAPYSLGELALICFICHLSGGYIHWCSKDRKTIISACQIPMICHWVRLLLPHIFFLQADRVCISHIVWHFAVRVQAPVRVQEEKTSHAPRHHQHAETLRGRLVVQSCFQLKLPARLYSMEPIESARWIISAPKGSYGQNVIERG